MKKIGIISDTHGYINPNVYQVFDGVEHIFHAGDVGGEDIITSLETLAPVSAVYGNIDTFPLTTTYPEILAREIDGVVLCMIHEIIPPDHDKVGDALNPLSKPVPDLLIYGHSHQAKLERRGTTLLFNPGSAGKRRFSLRPAVGLLTIRKHGEFTPEIIYLDE